MSLEAVYFLSLFFAIVVLFPEGDFYPLAQVGLQLVAILLPWLPKYWG